MLHKCSPFAIYNVIATIYLRLLINTKEAFTVGDEEVFASSSSHNAPEAVYILYLTKRVLD